MTLAEFLVRKVGLLKAVKVAAFIAAWGIYSEHAQDRLTIEGYTAYWRQSVSTSYRERDLFVICFPEERNPSRLWALLRDVYDGREGRDVLGARVLGAVGRWD